jgi:catechol 2,3-dioxygenase-like lactoylglutathione lyase family enzyme
VTVHHVTLTVLDAERSAEWYQRVLGPAEAITRAGDGWHRIRMAWPDGLIIGVTAHEATAPGDAFDARRVGLDHFGLACASEDEVRAWATRLDDLGVARGPVEEAPYAWAVTARDPDGIAIEFFCPRP